MARRKKVSTAQKVLLTIPDVAIQLDVCRATVYNLMYSSGLPYVKVGGARRVHPTSLDEWIRRNERGA